VDEDQKFLWKAGTAIFAVLIAGVWIWSWMFPEDQTRYVPQPSPIQTEAPVYTGNGIPTYSGPCDDEYTAEDYRNCLEDSALDDWQMDREAEAGLP
jgi:hypothetical protein